MNGNLAHLAFAFAAGLVLAALLGIAAAWWLHRRTMLSAWNIYLAWALTCPVALAAMASGGKAYSRSLCTNADTPSPRF